MSIALNRLGALDAARKLQRRELTAVQLVRACFARIEQRENTIHAWTALRKQAALEHAEQLDKGPLRGPLHGLPIGVKDLFDTVDLPTRYGSPIYERHHPGLDAAAVALCRAPARSWSARPSPPNSPPTRPAPAQSAQRGPYARRFVQRLGRGGGRRHGAFRAGLADRRLHHPSGLVLRHRRLQATFGAIPRAGVRAWRNRWTPWAASPVRCRTSPCSRRC